MFDSQLPDEPDEGDRPEYLVYGQVADAVTACLRAGQAPDVEALVQQHPEMATQIRELVGALMVMQEVDPACQSPSGLADFAPGGRLGDYRIVREVGRGGMGIVYEAEQISLERRVALKVLPFAAVLDPRALQRFKNEAQAAASLHHAHIVPVYAVGCERGVRYYAMQFIEGQSLEGLIRELRQLAGLELTVDRGSEIAEGAETLLPPRPGIATTVEALAGLSTERSTKNPAYSRTVARLGQQAAEALEHAHQVGVVHRDIKPANLLVNLHGQLWVTDFGLARCQDDTRLTQTGDLVGTLRYMSPEQALAKHGLVDHLAEHWLAQEPQLEPVQEEFLLKALRFYQTLAPERGTDPVVRLETSKAHRRVGEIRHKLGQPTEAEEAYREALALLEPLARGGKAGADASAELAVTYSGLGNLLRFRGRRTEAEMAYRQGLSLFEELTADDPEQLPYQDGLAGIRNNLGIVLQALHRLPEAELAYRQAQVLLEKLARANPNTPAYRQDLATSQNNLATLLRDTGRLQEAETMQRQALAGWKKLRADYPSMPPYRQGLAVCAHNLAMVLAATDRSPEAEKAYRQALALRNKLRADFPRVPLYRQELASTQDHLGRLLLTTGRLAEAEEAYREAWSLREHLIREAKGTAYRLELARSCHTLCLLLAPLGRLLEAEEFYRQGLALLEELGRTDATERAFRRELGHSYDALGALLQSAGQMAEAEKAYGQAQAIEQELNAGQSGNQTRPD